MHSRNTLQAQTKKTFKATWVTNMEQLYSSSKDSVSPPPTPMMGQLQPDIYEIIIVDIPANV